MLVALGGADAMVFTGGIGENSTTIRHAVCHGLSELGLSLCNTRNASGDKERRIDDPSKDRISGGSANQRNIQLWIVPTNEELIVARQTVAAIGK
jgi:acetate kinase